MPYRICKIFEIENGHMLSKHPDLCRFPHGHTRKVEFVLEADSLDENNMVCDFKILAEAMKGFLDKWDHAMCMNTEDPNYETMKKAYGERIIGFKDRDPTTEVMAETIYSILLHQLENYRKRESPPYPLRNCVRIDRVRVWETSSSWAEYENSPESKK
jgi:6-pyruvoyltetrahydropterin/6-carboxytetrahydropterin synthase